MDKKMIFAILEDAESESVMRAMHDAGHPLTLIDSTGGLLRRGNSTLIAGVDATDVDDVLVKLVSISLKAVCKDIIKLELILIDSVCVLDVLDKFAIGSSI